MNTPYGHVEVDSSTCELGCFEVHQPSGVKLGKVASFAGTWFYVPTGTQGGIIARSKRDAIEQLAKQMRAKPILKSV